MLVSSLHLYPDFLNLLLITLHRSAWGSDPNHHSPEWSASTPGPGRGLPHQQLGGGSTTRAPKSGLITPVAEGVNKDRFVGVRCLE
jgi:hypothetical protein